MGATKKGSYFSAGEVNYKFLEALWMPGSVLRPTLMGAADVTALKQILAAHGIHVAEEHVVVFDVESARKKDYPKVAGAEILEADDFYVLVLPPTPKKYKGSPEKDEVYVEQQAWTAAYYHAHADSYGM